MTIYNQNENVDDFPLYSSIDAEIIMHRDAHFGGQFPLMLEYYAQEGKGVNPDFEIERIHELALLEKQLGQNLAGVVLTGVDAERVASAKEAYKVLRDLYDVENPVSKMPLLIADLILSESEEAEEEVEAIVKTKIMAVSSLIDLIRSEDFHDPLFPGYGKAPALATKCLGLIGDKKAIITLFESIGSGDFFDEDMALKALHAIGEPAKIFLLKVLRGRPINIDNERAAVALIAFKEDPEVSKACLEALKEEKVRADIPLATYLILVCEGLKEEQDRAEFLALMEEAKTPRALRQDFKAVAKVWAS
jgi:hypothetical protein